MRKALFVTLLCGMSANAADVRPIDIGTSCTTIREMEATLGSEEVPWKQIPGRELIAFRDDAFGREFTIVYFARMANCLRSITRSPSRRSTRRWQAFDWCTTD